LFIGLMIVDAEPYVLEYNVRFGDPETQSVLPRLETDVLRLLQHCASGTLAEVELAVRAESAVTVVLASEGYPGPYPKGRPISGLAAAAAGGEVLVTHAGTQTEGGQLVTSGGRVLSVTALDPNLATAQQKAIAAAGAVQFEGKYFRRDIGADLLTTGKR
jgi:phosphoribosylamine--glycine ligase